MRQNLDCLWQPRHDHATQGIAWPVQTTETQLLIARAQHRRGNALCQERRASLLIEPAGCGNWPVTSVCQ